MRSRSNAVIVESDTLHLVPEFLTQPLQVVVGGRRENTGRYESGERLIDLGPTTEKDFFAADGAGHYNMHHKRAYVNQAIDRLVPFYAKRLRVEPATART
jgi:hypothetical protein